MAVKYRKTENGWYKVVAGMPDGVERFVPPDPDNRHYQQLLVDKAADPSCVGEGEG